MGLLWRSGWLPLSPFLKKYGGDAWWAVMVYFGVRSLAPHWRLWSSAALALCIAYAVEFSQLLHAPWLDSFRRTIPGALILGNTFNPGDLPAYLVGVLLGWMLDSWLLASRKTQKVV